MAAKDYLELQRQRAGEAMERAMAVAAPIPQALGAAMRRAALTDRSRLLPVLALAASEAAATADGDPEAALAAATAIGLLHAATCARAEAFRQNVLASDPEAIAADALQAMAFGAIAAPSALPPERALRLSAILSRAALAEAAALAEHPAESPADAPAGDPLFAAAAELGAIAGGAPDDEAAALKAFGAELGAAYRHAGDTGGDVNDACPPDEAHRLAAFHAREAAARLMDIPGSPASAALSSLAENILAP